MAWRTREDEAGLYAGHAHSTSDDHDDENLAGVTARRKCVVVLLSVALVAVLLAIIVPITINLENRNKDSNSAGSVSSASAAATAACAASQYPATCMQSLQNTNTTSALVFTEATLTSARDGVDNVRLAVENISTPANAPAVQVCVDTLNVADEELTWIIGELNGNDSSALNATLFQDMKVRLTAAMEMHTTCVDAFQESGTNVSASVQALMDHTNEIFSVALSFLSLFAGVGDNIYAWAAAAGYGGSRRRLLSYDFEREGSAGEIPSWVEVQHHRHLLQTNPPGSYINVTVAANGTGNYRRIMDALKGAPLQSKTPYVIYIKAGVYLEQVHIIKNMTNIMFIGDGIGKTIISVSFSVALTPNMTTFLSPALSTLILLHTYFCFFLFTMLRSSRFCSSHGSRISDHRSPVHVVRICGCSCGRERIPDEVDHGTEHRGAVWPPGSGAARECGQDRLLPVRLRQLPGHALRAHVPTVLPRVPDPGHHRLRLRQRLCALPEMHHDRQEVRHSGPVQHIHRAGQD